MNYDLKFAEGEYQPKNLVYADANSSDPARKILFRHHRRKLISSASYTETRLTSRWLRIARMPQRHSEICMWTHLDTGLHWKYCIS